MILNTILLSRSRWAVALLGLAALTACGPAPAPVGINDPAEASNRRVHDFNRGVDRAVLRPAARGYGTVLPQPVQRGIGNFAGNLDVPGDVVNNLLQARLGFAAQNTARFAVNSVLGIGGLFDPASAMGLPGKETDFGETMHVWGAPEGVYGEAPFFGPTTERDLVGSVVDLALNPVRLLLPTPERSYATAAKLGSKLGERDRYRDTLDSVLYESADSYAQTRLLYLQNRRFELGQTGGVEDDFIDPYATDADAGFVDPYAADLSADSFEDPYAQ